VNVAPPGGGNFGLLRNEGQLTWPNPFDREMLRGNRQTVDGLLIMAVRSLRKGPKQAVDPGVLAGLEGGIKRLTERLTQEVNEIPRSQYLEARRYLNHLADAVRALKSPAVGKFLDGTYAARGNSVEELVEHLRGHALEFAAAVPGQEG